MVHSKVYLNKYVVSIVPFSNLPSPHPTPSQKTVFACFRFLFFIHFPIFSADPICRYVRTPMHNPEPYKPSMEGQMSGYAGGATRWPPVSLAS